MPFLQKSEWLLASLPLEHFHLVYGVVIWYLSINGIIVNNSSTRAEWTERKIEVILT